MTMSMTFFAGASLSNLSFKSLLRYLYSIFQSYAPDIDTVCIASIVRHMCALRHTCIKWNGGDDDEIRRVLSDGNVSGDL